MVFNFILPALMEIGKGIAVSAGTQAVGNMLSGGGSTAGMSEEQARKQRLMNIYQQEVNRPKVDTSFSPLTAQILQDALKGGGYYGR
jgi:hypothetical protein